MALNYIVCYYLYESLTGIPVRQLLLLHFPA